MYLFIYCVCVLLQAGYPVYDREALEPSVLRAGNPVYMSMYVDCSISINLYLSIYLSIHIYLYIYLSMYMYLFIYCVCVLF